MIHQLRYILGDDLFFDATCEYLKRYAGSNADTHDYMKVMEEKSGLSARNVPCAATCASPALSPGVATGASLKQLALAA